MLKLGAVVCDFVTLILTSDVLVNANADAV
jgi:hypothetical protein